MYIDLPIVVLLKPTLRPKPFLSYFRLLVDSVLDLEPHLTEVGYDSLKFDFFRPMLHRFLYIENNTIGLDNGYGNRNRNLALHFTFNGEYFCIARKNVSKSPFV